MATIIGNAYVGKQYYIDGIHYWADNYKGDPINKFLSRRVIENILKKFVILINKHPNREQLELEEVLEECWDETEKYFKGKEK